jgi:hypothetical protein
MPATILDKRSLDLASLIALWFAIHGGDPAPTEILVEDETAALIAAALDRHLADRYADVTVPDHTAAQVEEWLKSLGIEVLADNHERDKAEFGPVQPAYLCFKSHFPNGEPITISIRRLSQAG